MGQWKNEKRALSQLEKIVLTLILYFNSLRTGDADLSFYITSVQDG